MTIVTNTSTSRLDATKATVVGRKERDPKRPSMHKKRYAQVGPEGYTDICFSLTQGKPNARFYNTLISKRYLSLSFLGLMPVTTTPHLRVFQAPWQDHVHIT